MVDTKSLSSQSRKFPTGTQLFWLLTVLLGGITVGLNQLFWEISPFQWLFPLALTSLASGLLGYWVIPWLQRVKAGQVIQEDGPQTHLKKAGTPTMGGIFFIPVAVIIAVILAKGNLNVMAISLVTLAYMGIGLYDDWQILQKKSNKGISPRMKLILQILIAVGFCSWVFWSQPDSLTTVALPLGILIPLGFFYWILSGFVLVAESNATNLTDGVDGLAGGTCALAFLGMAALVAPSLPALSLFCLCISGGCLGFIVHNRNPAKVFMGDTGSLALGGALGAVGVISGQLWGLLLVSGLFFIESLSVIAQVTYYKATKDENGKGKRLLKMAPLHHHLELSGWTETQIVGAFYLINSILAVVAVVSR
ncbi:MAG: phospho-N-acetylmuramoyl-pentapeptide-transferase [Microcystaceae cyanobacterium]